MTIDGAVAAVTAEREGPAISVDHLSRRFGDRAAFADLSFVRSCWSSSTEDF